MVFGQRIRISILYFDIHNMMKLTVIFRVVISVVINSFSVTLGEGRTSH